MSDGPANLLAALEAGRGCQQQGFTFATAGGREDFVSWDRLRAEAISCAARLLASGLKRGDRLALVIPDARDFVPIFLGAVCAGVIPAPFHAPASLGNIDSYTESLAAALKKIEPAYLATTAAVAGTVLGRAGVTQSLVGIITAETLRGAAPPISFECAPLSIPGHDVAFLQFTSGSTGGPKAVEVTHEGLRANARAIMRESLNCDSKRDHGVSWLPLTHDMGLVGFVLSPLFHKVGVTFIPTTSFARNASIWLDTIHKKRATISFAPNFAYALATKRATASHLLEWDLSCVRALGCGAEPINPETMHAFIEKFSPCNLNPCAILPCYGMAEATLAVSFGRSDEVFSTDLIDRADLFERRRATPVSEPADAACAFVNCGPPLKGHEVIAFDERGRPLGTRQVGELWMRGPSVARGYHGDRKASQQTFACGWLRTGDLGYVADGSIYVTGRKKDLIIINGRKYDPHQIEWLLDGIPTVRDGSAIAFSVPGNATEELVVIVEARTKDPEALQELLKSRIAAKLQLMPSKIVVAAPGALPRTASGKRRRASARQRYLDNQAAAWPTWPTASVGDAANAAPKA